MSGSQYALPAEPQHSYDASQLFRKFREGGIERDTLNGHLGYEAEGREGMEWDGTRCGGVGWIEVGCKGVGLE